MTWSGDNQDDLELVAKFKATGEGRYFAELFDHYHKRVYFIAYSMFENRVVAEDLVQETFVRAFEQIAAFDERDSASSFYAWLCRICRNACLDEIRKSQVRVRYQKERLAAAAPQAVRDDQRDQDGYSIGGSSYRAQDLTVVFRQMDEELKKVSEEKRICWLLFYVEGHSYMEIADDLGLTFEEVKTSIRAVNRHLKRIFR